MRARKVRERSRARNLQLRKWHAVHASASYKTPAATSAREFSSVSLCVQNRPRIVLVCDFASVSVQQLPCWLETSEHGPGSRYCSNRPS